MSKNIRKFIDNSRFEGESGVQNLARLAGKLGYHDRQYFGQFQNGCYGDLILFLEDNPGAVEAILEWVGDEYVDDEGEDDLDEEEDEEGDDE